MSILIFAAFCLVLAIAPSWVFIYFMIKTNRELYKTIAALSATRVLLPSIIPRLDEDTGMGKIPDAKVETPSGHYL